MDNIPTKIKDRTELLQKTIEYHRHLYHTKDKPEITDQAYDSLVKELESLEQKYPLLKKEDSVLDRVGGEPLKEFSKVNIRFLA